MHASSSDLSHSVHGWLVQRGAGGIVRGVPRVLHQRRRRAIVLVQPRLLDVRLWRQPVLQRYVSFVSHQGVLTQPL